VARGRVNKSLPLHGATPALAYHLNDSRSGQYDPKRNQNMALFSDVLGLHCANAELGAMYLALENEEAYGKLCEFMNAHHESLSKALGTVEKIVSARYDAYQSRIKAIHSIHKKMLQNNLFSPYQVLDILAIRIILNDVRACYSGVKWAASTWKLVGIKDYIANPKSNGYQSLHVLVQVSSWTVELQFRTVHMHSEAEYGRASHVSYKETATQNELGTISALKRLKSDGF
jgi:(p)ppGpp synthase/HD superfamily hydrolase